MLNFLLVDDIITRAINEDLNYYDVTTDTLIPEDLVSTAFVTFKESGVFAGGFIFERVFKILGDRVQVEVLKEEGEWVNKGEDAVKLTGHTRDLLKGERVSLNLVQRLSGIATLSRQYSECVKNYPVKIVDTRKTTPNLRLLEKYSVRVGGCFNHRFNLSDAVMIKDNHIVACGAISDAVLKARNALGHLIKIEVEVKNLIELEEAIASRADVVMLDNMDVETMVKAVEINGGRVILEASGGITLDNLERVAQTGVDVISIGALTHSARALDLSMNIR